MPERIAMFDQTTGQVFKEWTIPRNIISAHAADDWSRRRPYPLFKPRGTFGPRSLVDMTINVIANNIGDVKGEYFEGIPVRMQWRIWRFLEARGVSLHAWKIFSQILQPEDDDKTLGLYRFRQHICRPDRGLRRFVQPLTSLTVDFITHLVISGNCLFDTHEMLCLTDIKNLGILELIQPADELRATYPEVSDRLVRGWTEKEDPFPLLRILRIWGDRATTQQSLHWISKFPSLAMYDVKGSRQDWSSPHDAATAAGWETQAAEKAIPGLDDSLLRYLMMFAPLEELRSNRLRDLARSTDADLVSLCSDSRCAVKFVRDGQAPALLDYLTDTAKVQLSFWDLDAASREARACHGIAFEAWAFWIYSFIGQLSDDGDLKNRGVGPNSKVVAGPFVLPSKPMASVYLGHSGRGGISSNPAYLSRGLFETKRYTFIRPTIVHGEEALKPGPTPVQGTNLVTSDRGKPVMSMRKQKRKRMDDVLQSFSN